jgi:hypothetical protein
VKRTEWFPSSQPPKRSGWYEVTCSVGGYDPGARRHYDARRRRWSNGGGTALWPDSFGEQRCSDRWRGLTEPAK